MDNNTSNNMDNSTSEQMTTMDDVKQDSMDNNTSEQLTTMDDVTPSGVHLMVSKFLHHANDYTYKVCVTQSSLTVTRVEPAMKVTEEELYDVIEDDLTSENEVLMQSDARDKSFNDESPVKGANLPHEEETSAIVKQTLPFRKEAFQCSKCNLRFLKKQCLDVHKCNPSKFKCHICGQTWPYKSKLKRHMMIHNDQKPYQCSQCGIQFKNKHCVRRHVLNKHDPTSFNCDICGQIFRRKDVLSRHVRLHVTKILTPLSFKCNFCGLSFREESKLVGHLASRSSGMCFLEQLKLLEAEGEQVGNPKQTRAINSGSIVLSGEGPSSRNQLLSSQSAGVARSSQNEPVRNRPLFTCGVCDAIFYSLIDVKAHIQIHPQPLPFHCNVCGKGFINNRDVRTHQATHERIVQVQQSEYKPHGCTHCRKKFASLDELRIHNVKHLTKSNQFFKCGVCGIAFTREYVLLKHLKKHPQDMPYHCDECGKGFDNDTELSSHKTVHTQIKEELFKRNRCHYCGKCFARPEYLRKHIAWCHVPKKSIAVVGFTKEKDSGLRGKHVAFDPGNDQEKDGGLRGKHVAFDSGNEQEKDGRLGGNHVALDSGSEQNFDVQSEGESLDVMYPTGTELLLQAGHDIANTWNDKNKDVNYRQGSMGSMGLQATNNVSLNNFTTSSQGFSLRDLLLEPASSVEQSSPEK